MTTSLKHAEGLLFGFPVNYMRWCESLTELRRLRSLTDYNSQTFESPPSSRSAHSDPTANYYEQISAHEHRLLKLGRRIVPVMRLRNWLKNSDNEASRTMFLIMELYYFERMKLKDIAFHLQKSMRSVIYLKHNLLKYVIKEADRLP